MTQQDQDYYRFTQLLKKKSGIDLILYKENQMIRRLTNFREKIGFRTFVDFFHAMDKDRTVYDEFLDHMTINVSEFYRNPNRWEYLQNRVIPELLTRANRIKCWSAACSTGEEPYTLSMILSGFLPVRDIQVLATDIDQTAMDKAKEGKYRPSSVKDVPKALLAKHFSMKENLYRISEDLKKCVRFKKQNLLADPFEQGFDLIVCRNVLIYFTEEAKEDLFRKFGQALRKGGYLFVGGTEQIINPGQFQLEPVSTFFYRKI
ncbi:CheR family methyltransferase [Cohnella luojiensis]|uniref:protein-glutamate O-methyltransferase n=1 Tax=Cohnella luojiensis TaxID=652876 RepID=A0A4Y8M0W9_9BACL|nr:protein-glutamate O-methyltransferase CheR [Cohnella luojiensis]TFE25417.1 protein-glutamate O-methyltransferase CheR [Cohnella luojiensis]